MKSFIQNRPGKTLIQKISFVFLFVVGISISENIKADDLPRGAQVPYLRYESEEAYSNGTLLGPTYDQSLPASEASQRYCVQLTETSTFIRWIIEAEAQGLVLRYSIPDASTGGGINRSLTLYINSTDTIVMDLTSKYAWQYFSQDNTPSNDPSSGEERMRFDELRLVLPNVLSVGDTLTIKKEAGDTADYYIIDFIELETIPEAIVAPEGYLNVLDYGAIPNDGTNDYTAFNSTITAARNAGTGVYVPAGKFNLNSSLNLADNVTIQGAGIWHTELFFTSTSSGGINGNGTNLHVSDFYMTCNNTSRQNYKGFRGYWGKGSTISDVWSVHFECGAWIADYSDPILLTDSLIISNCRFRNTYADGCNLAKGTKNTIVENCNFRNTGDDAMASWSSDETVVPACYRNTFRNNTVENTYRAGGLGLFGGTGHSAHHCIIKDMLNDGGIRITSIFPGHLFSSDEYFDIHDMTLERTGPRTEWNNVEGAINIQTRNSEVHHLKFSNITIIDPVHHGIFIKGENNLKLTEIYFDTISIVGSGNYGIYIADGTLGWARKSELDINTSTSGDIYDIAPFVLRDRGIENLTVTTTTGGSVTLDPPGGSYATGTVVSLTAVPSTGYVFVNWTGDAAGTQNQVEVTMDDYKSVKANFDEISSIPVVTTKTGVPTVAPNPVTNFVNIQFNSLQVEAISVLDITGKRLMDIIPARNSVDQTIDFSNLQNGVYFVSLASCDKKLVYKLIKQ